MVDRPKLASTIVDDDAPADAAVARADTASLRRGAALGRYVVLDELGAGGMGVVYAAYDPELDRKLAVKLLRDDLGGAVDRRARLLREAQALARLDHPNVVAVYDVGTIGDHVFIAMEFVAGQTVTAWLAERPRDWRAIIGVYVLAGRGLAAAHALGIVHRDFKPDNVLIDGDGRVRVVDFGLARTSEDAADAPSRSTSAPDWERQTDGSGRAALAQTITRTGTLMGTPGYIAPEIQHGKTSPAVDQFSFCVALWRALYGELPFAGESAAELAAAAAEGKLRAPARQTRVPARIHRVLVRGLSANPEDRFASMDKLLDALAHHSARRRYVIATCVTVPIVLASVIGLGAMRSDDSQICRGAERQLAGVWDPDHRAAISRAFAATKMPFATTSAAGVTGLLDQYAGAWSTMRTEACEATRVRGEQSEELLDLRMACLDARARELRAFADVLAHADAKTVEKSFQAAQALSPLSDCADSAGLKAPVRLPANPAIRAQIAELRGNLAEARALDIAGKFKDAIARAQPLVVAARATHYRPLEATALTVLGTAQRNANDYPAAQQTLEAAVAAAIAARDDATAADAATSLVRVVAYDRAKPEDGEPWIARAQAFLEAHDDERVRAQLDNNVGIVRFAADRFDEALAQYQTSLALRERLYGAQSPLVAASLDNIGLVYDSKGEYARGTDFHKRALAIDLEALGPMHPSTALTLTNLAVSLHNQGLFDEALTTAQRAVMIKEAAYGPESAPVAMSLNEIGNIYFFQAR
ncbi:MAG: serine/threonine kinase family protein, partial [Myxococcales bacterium]|nr:serine/threonine kinase family protein [Myxococcales bacterium]